MHYLGIDRATIGDIMPGEGDAEAFFASNSPAQQASSVNADELFTRLDQLLDGFPALGKRANYKGAEIVTTQGGTPLYGWWLTRKPKLDPQRPHRKLYGVESYILASSGELYVDGRRYDPATRDQLVRTRDHQDNMATILTALASKRKFLEAEAKKLSS